MPAHCPNCDNDLFDHALDPDPVSIIEEEADGYIPISTTLQCKKCGFKWVQFYEEQSWTTLEEFEGEAYCSIRSPRKPYREIDRISPMKPLID